MRVGKVQVSSAIHIDWSSLDLEEKRRAWAQLASFAEDRYLHQTTISTKNGIELVEDLPFCSHAFRIRLNFLGSGVSISMSPFLLGNWGALRTTQDEIRVCLDFMKAIPTDSSFFTGHWEVEPMHGVFSRKSSRPPIWRLESLKSCFGLKSRGRQLLRAVRKS